MTKSFRRFRASRHLSLAFMVTALSSGMVHADFDTPDPTFGTGGVAQFTFGNAASEDLLQLPADAALDTEGRIYVIGASKSSGDGSIVSAGIVRLTPDGAVDTSYGTDGFAPRPAVTFQDGTHYFDRIAVAADGTHLYLAFFAPLLNVNVVVARTSLTGEIDPTFGTDGLASFSWVHSVVAGGIIPLADGKVVITGAGVYEFGTNYVSHAVVARLTADGELDSAFGNDYPGRSVGTSKEGGIPKAGRPFKGLFGSIVAPFGHPGTSYPSPDNAVADRFDEFGTEIQWLWLREQGGAASFEMGASRNDGSMSLLARVVVDEEPRYSINVYGDDVNGDATGLGEVTLVPFEPLIDVLAKPLPAGGPVLLIGKTKSAPHYAAVERIQGSAAFADALPPAPAAPTGVTAAAGDGEVTLTWSAVAGAASYDVYQSESSGSVQAQPVLTGITSTGAMIPGLDNGTTYYFVIRAVGPGGIGPSSNEVFATPAELPIGDGNGGVLSLPMLAILALAVILTRRRPVYAA